jgi:four helix bundle protein
MYKSFSDMPVWNNAHELSIAIFDKTVGLPKSEDYGLSSQIRRTANSISANIAEAFGRKTQKDKANFYTIARGSAYETQSHLLYGVKVGYFVEKETGVLVSKYTQLIFELNKIIATLLNYQSKSQSKP